MRRGDIMINMVLNIASAAMLFAVSGITFSTGLYVMLKYVFYAW